MMIDLQQFCDTSEYRPYMRKPFSRGVFTYALNGIIGVRVPRLADAPEQENPEKPNLAQIPWDDLIGEVHPVALSLPPKKPKSVEECPDCFDGKEHDCPDCDCVCESCDGTNKIEIDGDRDHSIDLFGIPFDLKYVRLVAALPGIQIGKWPKPWRNGVGLAFVFEGGTGLLMPLGSPYKHHITEAAAA